MSITGCSLLEHPGISVSITGTKTMSGEKRDFFSNSVCWWNDRNHCKKAWRTCNILIWSIHL